MVFDKTRSLSMNLKKIDVERFERLPDKHGSSYNEIEEFKPKNFIKLENYIRGFLDINNEELHKEGLIVASMLVAPWGIGKTTTYDILVKKIIQEDNYEGFSIKLTAEEISEAYENFKDKPEFKAKYKIGDRFLFLLTKLLFDEPEFKKEFPDLERNHSDSEDIIYYVSKVFKRIKEKYKFFLIFIDELEEVIKSSNDIIPFILKSVKHLLNGRSNVVNNSINPELVNFLSLILACTDVAIYEIARLEVLEYQYGGINRRIHEEKILGIFLEEAIEYLMKLNKYSYNGKIVKSFTNSGASFNTIARMAMMNPGYMKSYFSELMSSASDKRENYMQQIDGEFLLKNSKSFYLEYMDVKRLPINKEVYDNWFTKFRVDEVLLKLLCLFIGEIKAFSTKDLIERFDEQVSPNEILKKIHKFNEYIEYIHPNIKNAIIPVYLFKENINSADIQNILKKNNFLIEDDKETLISTIKFLETDISLNQFMDSISYFESNSEGKIIQKFYSAEKDILKQLFSYLQNASVTILKLEFEKYIDKSKEYYIINPNLYDIIFPVPIPTEYNLFKDKNENIRLWNEISRSKNRDLYKRKICTIFASFISFNDLDLQLVIMNETSSILKIGNFPYFDDILDKNKFIIVKDVEIKELSNNPMNIMIWREIGDYDNNIMNEITQRIDSLQRNELYNIHVIFLLSQNKIPEDNLIDLSNKLEYSIVKEIPLKQLDVIKYAFLDEVVTKYKIEEYNYNKYLDTLKKLILPMKDVIDACKISIEEKGLDIKLNKYMEKLSDIPQLFKFILYDFINDYNNWDKVDLKKPFEHINPIGLSIRYGSSLDDYSSDTLRKLVDDYLIENEFLELKDGSITISMPKIERKILELVKNISSIGMHLTVSELASFFFNTSSNPSLLNTVFLTDLGNRGLIQVKKEKSIKRVFLLEINEQDLKDKLSDLNLKIKKLFIKDLDFYHILTIKKKGYNLIYLNDFIDELERLLELRIDNDFNKHFNNTRKFLFLRIYNTINGILENIFIPLTEDITALRKNLSYTKEDIFLAENINSRLKKFGIKEINIENFSEIRDSNEKYREIFSKMDSPVDRLLLKKMAKDYYNKHKNDTEKLDVVFSYRKLKENKLTKPFVKPFLNLIYNQIEIEKKSYLSAPIFEKIKEINQLAKTVDNNSTELEGYFATAKNYSGELAKKIFQNLKTHTETNFNKEVKELNTLNDVETSLKSLNTRINGIHVPLSRIISRKGKKHQLSLLDEIDREEISHKASIKEIHAFITYLVKNNIIKQDDDLCQIAASIDYEDMLSKINESKNMEELENESKRILFTIENKNNTIENSLNSILKSVIKFFKEMFNLNYLKKRFTTFRMEIFVKQCISYERNIDRLLKPNQKVNYEDICNQILHFKEKIIEGQNKLLKDNVGEEAQKVFIELQERYGEQKWFNKKDFDELIEELKIPTKKVEKLLEDLKEKELIEESFRFN